MNTKMMLALAGAAIAAFGLARVAADAQANDAPTLHDAAPAGPSVARGRYLAKIAGCNDCHTPAYAMRGGDVPEESLMLTSDFNIVDLDFVIQWNISSAEDFIFNIEDPENTLRKVAQSAIREVVGQTRMFSIITTERGAVADSSKAIMQKMP